MTSTSVLHEVPYYSQYQTPSLVTAIAAGEATAADDNRWFTSGASSQAEYVFWAPRICGVACARMALAHWRPDSPTPRPVPFALELVEAGAYTVEGDKVGGLHYAPFAEHMRAKYGLGAEVATELEMPTVRDLVRNGHLVVLSVHKSIRSVEPKPPSRGGHLVLAVGADDRTVTLHNPSGLPRVSQQNHRVAWDTLDRFFARRGLVLSAS